jgi:SOS response regulatory protein OraA/RecX
LNYLEQDKNIQSIVASNKEQYLLQATKLAKEYSLKYGKKEDNPYLLQQKIKHALYRKGYSMGVINLAIENISDHLFPS